MNKEAPSYDLFISHSSVDEDFAKKLARNIELKKINGRNLKTFLYQWDIKPGENIVSRLDEAFSKARFIALILSPDYLLGDWTTAEKDAAIFLDPSGRLRRVIPLMYKNCKLPPLLGYRRYIDFTKLSYFKSGLELLISSIICEQIPSKGNSEIESNSIRQPLGEGIDSVVPDKIEERIYPNFYSVIKLPKYIWSAPTEFRSKTDLFHYYGRAIVNPCILENKRLFCFADLNKINNPFVGVIEEYDIQQELFRGWLDSSEGCNRFIKLMNDSIRSHARRFRLSYDKIGDKYYYQSGTLKEDGFKAFAKGRGKEMILEYPEALGGLGIKAHRAVNLKFLLIKNDPYLHVETGWVFTHDGYRPIEGRRRSVLNTRFMSNQKNMSNFNEIRYWLWFLSVEGRNIKFDVGDSTLDVDINPISITIQKGIYEDQRKISPTESPPEISFEDTSEESIVNVLLEEELDDEG